MTKTLYLTTTLPYVNAAPHIGHALEFFQADAYVRYFRKKLGKGNVFFNVGTDEHGLKNYQKAKELGKTPQEYVDEYAAKWREFCELFNISYDNFYRTSDKSHYGVAQKFWEIAEANGNIYKKKYEGLYCVGCEEFKTEKELVDGKCPIHGTVPIQYSEENYFFKLSKYKDVLLNYYKDHSEVLRPEWKHQELENFIKNMEDISISRLKKNLPWGIPVPNDPEQVMYVWFDALTNYIGAVGFGSNESKFNELWNNNDLEHLTVQLFGPDNLRFQCAIWQGMLASAGIQFTKKFLCHGTILASDGTKMSKTKGNVVSPFDQQAKFGTDAVRYYMLSKIPTFGDSAYSESDLINHYNADLANNFGNLLNRVIHLANTRGIKLNPSQAAKEFKTQVDSYDDLISRWLDNFDLNSAADEIKKLSDEGNKYIDTEKPWVNKDKSEEVLNNLSYLLYKLIELYEPYIPNSVLKAKEALDNQKEIILFEKFDESESIKPEVKLDPTITSELEEAKIAYKVFDIPKLNEAQVKQYVDSILEEIKAKGLESYLNNKNIAGYKELHNAYKVTEDTSCVTLVKTIFEDKFPRINPIIDLYNIISVKTTLAFGLHDTQKITGNITLKVINQDIEYYPLGSKNKAVAKAGTYSAIDNANDIACYSEVKQSEKTKTTPKTKRALIYVQGNKNVTQEELDAALKLFFDKLNEFSLNKPAKINIQDLLKPITIAKVLEINKHPNADRLLLVQVDLGSEKKQVVTGANNFKIGDLVPYLGEGNVIPGYLLMNGEKIVLQKKNLRGIESDSMILAEDEIGLSHDHEGIYIIERGDELVGKSLLDVLSKEQTEQIQKNVKNN